MAIPPYIKCQLHKILDTISVYDLVELMFDEYPRETLEDVLLLQGFTDIETQSLGLKDIE